MSNKTCDIKNYLKTNIKELIQNTLPYNLDIYEIYQDSLPLPGREITNFFNRSLIVNNYINLAQINNVRLRPKDLVYSFYHYLATNPHPFYIEITRTDKEITTSTIELTSMLSNIFRKFIDNIGSTLLVISPSDGVCLACFNWPGHDFINIYPNRRDGDSYTIRDFRIIIVDTKSLHVRDVISFHIPPQA